MNEESFSKKLDIFFDFSHADNINLDDESEKILNLI